MNHQLSGVYAASLTPLKTDLSPDLQALHNHMEHLEDHGCHGALILGTTGEGPSFSKEEKRSIICAAQGFKQGHSQFQLLVGTGTTSLEESIELTKLAFTLGSDGVVVLPPYYFGDIDDLSLFAWFDSLIINAVPNGKHLLVYNIPHMTGISFTPDLLEKLLKTHPDRFAGIKDSSSDRQYSSDLSQRFGDTLLVLTGNDKLISHTLKHHSGGSITALANLCSNLIRELWDNHQIGNQTGKTQKRISALREIMEEFSPFAPLLKAMMHKMYGAPLSPVKPPLRDLNDSDIDIAFHRINGGSSS